MSIKMTRSKRSNFTNNNNNRDKVTSFMITMTEQFIRELESSRSIKETLIMLQEFIMVLQTVMTMDDKN